MNNSNALYINANRRINALKNDIDNPEYSTETESYTSITPLISTARGNMGDMLVSGQTATNLVTNGDFASGTTGWGTSNATGFTVNNGIAEFTATARFGQIFKNNVPTVEGKTFFLLISIKTTSNDIRLFFNGVSLASSIGSNQFEKVYAVRVDSGSNSIAIVDNRSSAWDKIFVEYAVAIPMTEYENYTTAQMNERFPNYFDGSKSVDKMRVLSVGKNLFDKSKHTLSTATYTVRYYVKPSTQYAVSNSTNFEQYDSGDNLITTTLANLTITPASNVSYIIPRNNDVFSVKDTYMLVEGSVVPTTYKPYSAQQAICPLPLRNVPAITDTFDALEGKHTQNITSPESIATTVYDTYATTYTNVDVVKTTAFSTAVAGTTGADGRTRVYNKDGVELEEVAQADIDLVASVGKYYYHTDKTIWFVVAKAAYGTKQVETATCTTGAVTNSGNITVTVTANGMSNSPKNVVVAVVNADTVNDVGGKVRAALALDVDVTGFFTVSGADASVILTAINTAADDVTMAIVVVDTDTTGVVFGASVDTTAGVAGIEGARTGLATSIAYLQLATPIPTYFPSRVLSSEASGTIYQDAYVGDQITIYGTAINIEDVNYPIVSLDYVSKIDISTGAMTKIPLSTCTVAVDGLSFTSTALASGDWIDFGYFYDQTLSLNAKLNYSHPVNANAQAVENTNGIVRLDDKVNELNTLINYINEVIVDMFQEQAGVAVSLSATPIEADILHFSASDTRYILRELTIKAVDPVADTITISLYGLVNDVLTVIDTHAITTANFGTYFNLIDMFGLVDFPGDEIKITATTDAGSYALTGQYSHALTRG